METQILILLAISWMITGVVTFRLIRLRARIEAAKKMHSISGYNPHLVRIAAIFGLVKA